jgi:hypothetical protein
MPNELPLPPELQHLIEKRESQDRRAIDARQGDDRRSLDMGPAGALLSSAEIEQLPETDRRTEGERRKQTNRRRKPRRKAD